MSRMFAFKQNFIRITNMQSSKLIKKQKKNTLQIIITITLIKHLVIFN